MEIQDGFSDPLIHVCIHACVCMCVCTYIHIYAYNVWSSVDKYFSIFSKTQYLKLSLTTGQLRQYDVLFPSKMLSSTQHEHTGPTLQKLKHACLYSTGVKH